MMRRAVADLRAACDLVLWARRPCGDGGNLDDFCEGARPHGLDLPAAGVRAAVAACGDDLTRLDAAVSEVEACAEVLP